MRVSADVGGRLFPELFPRKTAAITASQGEKIRTKCGFARTKCVRRRDLTVLEGLRMAPSKPEPRLHLGDLGAAYGHAVRRRAIELDDRAVALLAHEADMGDRHNMAAVHPDEQTGIKLGFGFRDRPRAHPLAGSVMDPRIVR